MPYGRAAAERLDERQKPASVSVMSNTERRALLEQLILLGPAWCTVSSYPGFGAELFAACVELELKGLVAKRLDAPYRPGERSRSWVRAKAAHWRDVAAHPSTASDYGKTIAESGAPPWGANTARGKPWLRSWDFRP